jgi:heterodisulfide reductase subunit C/nitrate reductase gamma subunit
MTPTRETFGNIPSTSQTVFYCLATVAMAIFAYGLWRRFRFWRRGQSIHFWQLFIGSVRQILTRLVPGLYRLLVEGLGQKRVGGRGLASRAHGLLFAGFMMLFLGTTLLEVDHLASMISRKLHFHRGTYYVIYEFTLDLFGIAFLVGTVLFGLRRHFWKPPSVGHRPSDWVVLGFLLAIGLTGYVVEALRISWQRPVGIGARCSPVGLWLSSAFSDWTEAQTRAVHYGVWWFHAFLALGFIAMIPFTRLLHLITGPMNLFVAWSTLGEMRPVSMEEVERDGRIGVNDVRHYTSAQLLSLDACMECGRCQDVCPAFATGKPLSPKKVVTDLRGVMERLDDTKTDTDAPLNPHEVIMPETLWSCTACSACVEVCPVRVDQLTLILDLRRYLTSEGGLSGTAATALRRMQSSANPWGLPQSERANWTRDAAAPSTE